MHPAPPTSAEGKERLSDIVHAMQIVRATCRDASRYVDIYAMGRCPATGSFITDCPRCAQGQTDEPFHFASPPHAHEMRSMVSGIHLPILKAFDEAGIFAME
jgi:hypothetical protein